MIEHRYHARVYNEARAIVDSSDPTTNESAVRSHARSLYRKYSMKVRHDGWSVEIFVVAWELRLVDQPTFWERVAGNGQPPNPEFVPPKYQD